MPWGECFPANSPQLPKGEGFPVLASSVGGGPGTGLLYRKLCLVLILQRRAPATWSNLCLLKIANHFNQAVWLLEQKPDHPEIPVGKYVPALRSRTLLLCTSVWPARGAGLSCSPWWP